MLDATPTKPRTLLDKIWADHVVSQDPGSPAVLAVDLHLVHEVTSPQAFTGLRARGLRVRRPSQTVATADHSVPTTRRNLPMLDEMAAAQISQLEQNCAEFGIPLHGIGDPSAADRLADRSPLRVRARVTLAGAASAGSSSLAVCDG